MGKVYFWTTAYNAEKTLRRTIDSVLNQTHDDFHYYICDNGSTDSTGEILADYAAKDKRIIPFKNNRNWYFVEDSMPFRNLPFTIGAHDYLCSIDADDEYEHGFLQKMLDFMNVNNLDVAACGTRCLNENSIEMSERSFVLQENMIMKNDEELADLFPVYYKYFRDFWGKLYKGFCVRDSFVQLGILHIPSFGIPARNALSAVLRANRVGILAEPLHWYYISAQSSSFAYDPRWLEGALRLCKFIRSYLQKYGDISTANDNYVNTLFFTLINQITSKLINADVSLNVKLNDLFDILSNTQVKALLNFDWNEIGIRTKKTDYLQELLCWVIKHSCTSDNVKVKRLIAALLKNERA